MSSIPFGLGNVMGVPQSQQSRSSQPQSSGGFLGFGGAPQAPDFQGIANQQLQANRPNQTNAFGAGVQWTQLPNGQWSQSQSFGGPMAGVATGLQNQMAQSMSTPFSLSGLGQMNDGQQARDQAINSAYGQATSRLDPQWAQREEQQRTQLLNQGLDPASEAYRNSMGELGNQRNDAYTSAMNMAIGQGTAAGDSVFRNGLMGRQQTIAEMLRQREQPMQELAQMQGFLQQPGFQQSNDMLAAAGMQGQYDMARYQADQQGLADMFGGLGSAVGSALPFLLCDERAKTEIVRHDWDVIPGVPFATWRYRPEFGGHEACGVIAQDLEKVAPGFVITLPDGFKAVNPAFLFEVDHG